MMDIRVAGSRWFYLQAELTVYLQALRSISPTDIQAVVISEIYIFRHAIHVCTRL